VERKRSSGTRLRTRSKALRSSMRKVETVGNGRIR
jgi:hypothetical protein